MVGGYVRLAFRRVDDNRVALADARLDLDVGREGRAAVADNTGRADALDALLIGHGSKVIRVHGLVRAVLAVVLDHDGQDLAAVLVQARLDRLYLTGNGCVDRSADKAAGFRDGLSQVHGITDRNDRLCRGADVHGNRQDDLVGQCQLLDRLGVCRGLVTRICMGTGVNAATERIHHVFHLSVFLRKKSLHPAGRGSFFLMKSAGRACAQPYNIDYTVFCTKLASPKHKKFDQK